MPNPQRIADGDCVRYTPDRTLRLVYRAYTHTAIFVGTDVNDTWHRPYTDMVLIARAKDTK